MKIKITDPKGKIVNEAAIHSMNHYLMLLNKLDKKKSYTVEFKEGATHYTRTISR
ncbi:MAG: hypothetical protein JXQ87_01375 [Bacteroidia bacterium]